MTIKTCPHCTFITESEILMRWHICSFQQAHDRIEQASKEADQLLDKVLDYDGAR